MSVGIIVSDIARAADQWHIPAIEHFLKALASITTVTVFSAALPQDTAAYEWSGIPIHAIPISAEWHQWQGLHCIHAFGADIAGSIALSAVEQLRLPLLVSLIDDELACLPDIGYGQQIDDASSHRIHSVLENADVIIAPSPYIQQLLATIWPSLAVRCVVVPFGVDTDFFEAATSTINRHQDFISVGLLTPEKDFETMLMLISHLPGATLRIYGDGPFKNALTERITVMKLADRVQLAGYMPHQRMPDIYRSARFLLVTSRYAASTVAALEAMACGTGVIGTPVGLLPELCATAPIGDLEALQRIIIKRNRTQSVVQRQRHRWMIQQSYTVQHMVERLHEFYVSFA